MSLIDGENIDVARTVIDTTLGELRQGERTWAATTRTRRRELLDQIRDLVASNAQAWVDAAADLKGLERTSPLIGEEWLAGPYALIGGLTALADTLAALDAGRSPIDGHRVRTLPNGRVALRVLPDKSFDRLLMSGFTAEVWMPPGIPADTVRRQAGLAELDPTRTKGVGVVLGAGNITSIAPLDALYELYANNRVVVVKLNPILDPLLPVYQRIFAPLMDLKVLSMITGGADVGGSLVQHEHVDHVHITGSAASHDAIVWGRGPEAAGRKADGQPLLRTPISSELGGVSPIIVLPGRWSAADLRFQAEHVATMRLTNGGYTCIAGQVVVIAADWAQKDAFLTELRAALERTPPRMAFYPGSDRRVADACDRYPDAERIGNRVLIAGGADRRYLLQTEFFAPVLGVIELPGADFLNAAVRSANDDFAGTLGVNLIAHPRTIRRLGSAFEAALTELRYGSIGVNAWTGVGFLTATGSWGAFPGHTLTDVQSGIGGVHNAMLLDSPERTVVCGPFRPFPRSVLHGEWSILPKPPWFVTNRTGARTARLMTAFAAAPTWRKLPAIFASALLG